MVKIKRDFLLRVQLKFVYNLCNFVDKNKYRNTQDGTILKSSECVVKDEENNKIN